MAAMNNQNETAGAYPVCGRRYETSDGAILIPRLVDEGANEIRYTDSDREGIWTATFEEWNVINPECETAGERTTQPMFEKFAQFKDDGGFNVELSEASVSVDHVRIFSTNRHNDPFPPYLNTIQAERLAEGLMKFVHKRRGLAAPSPVPPQSQDGIGTVELDWDDKSEPIVDAFVEGAKWWEWESRGATMWATDKAKAYRRAKEKYPVLSASPAPQIEGVLEVFHDALLSIANNTCCKGCQEARLVARKALGLAPIPAASPAPNSEISSDGPCNHCGLPCECWFTNSHLWNQVNGGETGLLCVRCFITKAEGMGISQYAWRLHLDAPAPTQDQCSPDKQNTDNSCEERQNVSDWRAPMAPIPTEETGK